jgi:hypothetical protein
VVDPPIPVEVATWAHAGTLDWWTRCSRSCRLATVLITIPSARFGVGFAAADVTFSSGDLAPALARLENRGLIQRARVTKLSHPRPGWIPGAVEVQLPTYSSISRKVSDGR